jgi:hypothetical protein
MSFKFHSIANGLPETKEGLHQLAFYAHAQFIHDGGEVKVDQPAFAVGCEMSSNVRSLIRRDQHLSLG